MSLEFYDNRYRQIVQEHIAQVFSGGDYIVVALTKFALRLFEYIYADCDIKPESVLVETLPLCASDLQKRKIERICFFDVFESNTSERELIGNEVSEYLPGVHYEIIAAVDFIEEYANANSGTKVQICNKLSELLCSNQIMPLVEFPRLSFKISNAENIDVLDNIVECNKNYSACPGYTIEEYGKKFYVFVLHTDTLQTYAKMYMWYDSVKSILYVVPAAPVLLQNDGNYLSSIFKETYNAVIWDHLQAYCNIVRPQAQSLDSRSSLCTIANYLYSFDRFTYFWQALIEDLNGRVSYNIGGLQIHSDNLFALCGIRSLTQEIIEELKHAYTLNFRLKPLNSLVENEQHVQMQFEKVNWLDPSDDNTNQLLFQAIKRSSNAEETLEACYTATGQAMGYPIAALDRAVKLGLPQQENKKNTAIGIHYWLDEQLLKGSVQTEIVLQLGFWKNVFCTGYNELDIPTQASRLVLNAFRRIQAILHRNDLPYNLLCGVITLSMMSCGIERIGCTNVNIKDRNVFIKSIFGERNIVDAMIKAGVLEDGKGKNLTIADKWSDSEYLKLIGLPEEVANEYLRYVAKCVSLLSKLPLQLYNYVLNMYFYPFVDVEDALQKTVNLHERVIEKLESIVNDNLLKSESDLSEFIQKTLSQIKDYIILWVLFEKFISDERYLSTLDGKAEQFISLQKLVQLINFDLKMILFLLVVKNPKYAMDVANGVLNNFKLDGKQVYPFDKFRESLEEYCQYDDRGITELRICLAELVNVNKKVYE